MKRFNTIQRMQQYCKDHELAFRSGASKSELEATISRAVMHLKENVIDGECDCCFGYYDDENMTCAKMCDFSNDCFVASMGTTKSKYYGFVKRIANPKIRFATKVTE